MTIYLIGCVASLILLIYYTRDEESYSIFFLIPLIVIPATSWLGAIFLFLAKLQEWARQTDLWSKLVDYEVKNPFHKK